MSELLMSPSGILEHSDMMFRNLRVRARTDLRSFVLYMKRDYDLKPHHAVMLRAIQSTIEEDEGRLYLGMPPQHGKSQAGTIFAIAWYLGRWPERNVQLISYADSLAGDFSLQIRTLIRDSERYREIFPNVALNRERYRLLDWRTTAGGGLRSVGVTGGLTGRKSNLTIIDDPHRDEHSPFEDIYQWYVTVARTRLATGSSVILIMTRWDLQDLAGRLLDAVDSDKFTQIVFPALALENDALGRKPGEALWPEFRDEGWLSRQKALDDRKFQALYQNNPRGADDVMFDVDRVGWISKGSVPSGARFWTVDLATTKLETSDYSVLARWTYYKDRIYLIDSLRVRETFAGVRGLIMRTMQRFPRDHIVFPKEFLELLILQDLQREVGSGRVNEVSMRGDKVQKAQPVSTLVANNRFRAVATVENDYFVREMGLFPQGRFDDCVDAAAVAAHYVGVSTELDWRFSGGARGFAVQNS